MLKLRFAPQLRLTSNAQIRWVCLQGRKINSPWLRIFFCPNQFAHPRLCVSISKKQINQAWQRNQIKRIVRESFRLRQHQLPSMDMVVIIYKNMASMDGKQQIRQVVDQQWERLAQYRKPVLSA